MTITLCHMCSGAIGLLARIPNVVYGAKNQKFGSWKSVRYLTDERLNHRVEVEFVGILKM